jgi:nucleotide-binding universal stress UspA family protein
VAAHAWERSAWEAFVGDPDRTDDDLTTDRVRAAVRAQVRSALPEAMDSGEAGGEITVSAPRGRPAIELMRLAAERSCDAIVVGQHGADGQEPGWFLGSTSHQLVARAPVPVIVVGADAMRSADRPPVIVAGWDGTAHANRAVAWAGELAASVGGRLQVVRADCPRTIDAGAIERHVATLLSDDVVRAVDIEARCVAGSPDEVVPTAARDAHACLVVLGGRPLGPMRVRTVGDVVAAVLAHPSPPMALVP